MELTPHIQDYPILATLPRTSFSCSGKAEGGLYADVETGCQVGRLGGIAQVFHTCGGGRRVVNKFSFIKYSTLCSNGTIYSQEKGVSACYTLHVTHLRPATGGTWWTAPPQRNTTSA